jgi:hypothetical protein
MCARGEMDIKGKGSMFTYWLNADALNARESIPVPVSTEQWDGLWVAPADLLATIQSGIALNL